jgi:glycosyltransferase involved in cell wall biosynthesis
VKLAVVVQRYGAGISGGAELHARYIAEHLSRHAEVDVFTTCASDYVTWANALEPGEERVNGITVRRFPVRRPRDPREFGRRSEHVFGARHSFADELAWLDSEGPDSPALIKAIGAAAERYDFILFFSYRYYHAWHGARAVPHKAVLVPTAERDPAIALAIFGPLFRGVRAIMYNSYEERAMIQRIARNESVPGVVVGVGSDIPEHVAPARFRKKFDVRGPFAIYVGRIDENKGCGELFDNFQRYAREFPRGLSLALVGSPVMSIPRHPRIRHFGYLPDEDKFDAMAAADVLIMPSPYESLSMVALEAWALGRPVLANGRCDVLKGQCMRSNAGLYYENYDEFVESLYALESHGPLNAVLGGNGREYFRRHYAWPVIERKYLEMFDRLTRESAQAGRMEPLPGWWTRRQPRVPAAAESLAAVPAGPVASRTDGTDAADPGERAGRPRHRPRHAEAAHARRA